MTFRIPISAVRAIGAPLVSKTELLNRPRATSKRIRSLCTQHQHFALARTFASAHKPSNCQGSAASKVSSLRTLVLQFPRSPVASPSWLWLAGSVPSCLALPGSLAPRTQRGANSMAGQSDIVSDKIPTQYRHTVRHNTDIVPTQYRHSPTTLSKITRRGRNPQNSKEQAVPRPSEAPQTPEIPVTTP